LRIPDFGFDARTSILSSLQSPSCNDEHGAIIAQKSQNDEHGSTNEEKKVKRRALFQSRSFAFSLRSLYQQFFTTVTVILERDGKIFPFLYSSYLKIDLFYIPY
jgi:hypothetical protein